MIQSSERIQSEPVTNGITVSTKDVEGYILGALGTPPDYHKCLCTRVTPHTFRINVYVRAGWSFKISDSFFVEHVGGRFVTNPPVTQKYKG